ncbi:MAG TPA: hypothetical protein VME44_12845 [Streptosporangiaceae bacterium]|nr:hypothetical protein [Streptosporangiaceae bacterium]
MSWPAVARSGAASRTARDLVARPGRPRLAARRGRVRSRVNDLKNLRSLRDWDQDVAALLAAIDARTSGVPVIVSGMAPGEPVPCAAPADARRDGPAMDHTLRRAAGDGHVPVNPQMIGSGFFAADGFQPSSQGIPRVGGRTRRTDRLGSGALAGCHTPAARRPSL